MRMAAVLGCALMVSTSLALAQSGMRARMAPVPASQQSSEQRALAARFAPSGMLNAVATYLNHPSLAEHILPFEHYVSSESGLPPRHRALLGLRTAWLTRSNYLWAHRAAAARRIGVTSEELTRVAHGPMRKAGTSSKPRCCALPTN